MKKEIVYHVAIYLRLSRDDEDIDGNQKRESDSIASQRELVRAFVKDQEDMELFDIYIDDGYSGSNFNRPDFKRMMEDIEAGYVNCVIVKDLSRFGRDYIEAGRFIQKTFPAFSVRFIAITDHFDSLTADHNTTSLVVPIKNFVNDSYCSDISQKVRSHQKVKRETGKYIGSFVVYGYNKDIKDKNHLVPDEYAAGIVKQIFAWKLDGMSNMAIANQLNELGVLSPLEYKKSCGVNYTTGFQAGATAKWSAVAVKRILVNEIYTGTMIQGKSEKVNYKVDKYIQKPESEWIKVEDTHESIISKDDYKKVQRLLQVDTRAVNGQKKAHLFAGVLFCGDCKEQMVRRKNNYKGKESIYYICSTRNRGEGCTRHSISEQDLSEVVFQILKAHISLFIDVSGQLEHIQKLEVNFEELTKFDKEIEKLRKEQEKYLQLRADLYEDLKMQVITEDDFRNFSNIYEQQYEESKKSLEKQEEMVKKLFRNGIQTGVKLERMKEAMQITTLDRDTLLTFVERIEVYEDKKIYVEFCNQEEFRKMMVLADYIASKPAEEVE